MDGKGRCLDNVFVERLWRTVKYEDIDLWSYETELHMGVIVIFQSLRSHPAVLSCRIREFHAALRISDWAISSDGFRGWMRRNRI